MPKFITIVDSIYSSVSEFSFLFAAFSTYIFLVLLLSILSMPAQEVGGLGIRR